ncbi:hypothetical protein IG631_21864 [Alternaria alternata]|nr:hypothetical protein IG631_21864 [Alternaria alternata]
MQYQPRSRLPRTRRNAVACIRAVWPGAADRFLQCNYLVCQISAAVSPPGTKHWISWDPKRGTGSFARPVLLVRCLAAASKLSSTIPKGPSPRPKSRTPCPRRGPVHDCASRPASAGSNGVRNISIIHHSGAGSKARPAAKLSQTDGSS